MKFVFDALSILMPINILHGPTYEIIKTNLDIFDKFFFTL